MNETPEDPAPVVTPVEQPLVTPQGNLSTTTAPENNLTVISPDPVPGNTTSSPVDTLSPIPGLNVTNTTPDASTPPGTNYTWSDPPLNASDNNPYYTGSGWIVNESGHVWVMDLNPGNQTPNSGTVTLTGNTFSGFGTGFAILINASNVIFDGMGAILDGGGHTQYGIIVQNSTGNDLSTINGPLGGISITNITLTGFTQAGIFFNNVIASTVPEIPTNNITNVNASGNTASGILLQNSQNIEVGDSHADNNGETGISLRNSQAITLINNTANQNGGEGHGYGIYLGGVEQQQPHREQCEWELRHRPMHRFRLWDLSDRVGQQLPLQQQSLPKPE